MSTANPLPLDAAARDELARKAEAVRAAAHAHDTTPAVGDESLALFRAWRQADREFIAAVTDPDVILALLASVRGAEADTRDAERYRFLRDNPLQLRAIDGNASFGGYVKWGAAHFDDFTDIAMADAARAHPPTQETDDAEG